MKKYEQLLILSITSLVAGSAFFQWNARPSLENRAPASVSMSDLRSQIKAKASDAKDYVHDQADKAGDKIDDAKSDIDKDLRDLKRKLKAKVNDAKDSDRYQLLDKGDGELLVANLKTSKFWKVDTAHFEVHAFSPTQDEREEILTSENSSEQNGWDLFKEIIKSAADENKETAKDVGDITDTEVKDFAKRMRKEHEDFYNDVKSHVLAVRDEAQDTEGKKLQDEAKQEGDRIREQVRERLKKH